MYQICQIFKKWASRQRDNVISKINLKGKVLIGIQNCCDPRGHVGAEKAGARHGSITDEIQI